MSVPSASVLIIDDLPPEDVAMLQALYSRDPQSVLVHLEKVRKAGSGKFMGEYYVGYNHKSIGDCGTTTLFVEGVSMLAAKAIQDHRLYNGQESSTRYIDFSQQEILDPLGTPETRAVQDRWMEFYFTSQPEVIAHLRDKYPRREGEKKSVYERAIAARCFDILRGFLPAGATTNVAWHTNLRQAADKLALLRYHPMPGIAALAEQILGELRVRYPNSFNHKLYRETESYRKAAAEEYTYFNPYIWPSMNVTSKIDPEEVREYEYALRDRPPKTELPAFMEDFGHIRAEFLLDFASSRDLQRHRGGIIRMPLLTSERGFHDWYYDQLPDHLRVQAKALVEVQSNAIRKLPGELVTRQYYIAMGFRVPVRMTMGLPALVYTLELRSGTTVHPTLRAKILEVARLVGRLHPEAILHLDFDPDSWDIRRGQQTIERRG